VSALDTIAGVAVGGYLIAVAVNGNSQLLIDQAIADRGFIKWAVAVGIALYMYKIPGMAEPVTMIIVAAFLALFLKNGTKIAEQATAFWDSLSEVAQ
jgi:hypothetical protein